MKGLLSIYRKTKNEKHPIVILQEIVEKNDYPITFSGVCFLIANRKYGKSTFMIQKYKQNKKFNVLHLEDPERHHKYIMKFEDRKPPTLEELSTCDVLWMSHMYYHDLHNLRISNKRQCFIEYQGFWAREEFMPKPNYILIGYSGRMEPDYQNIWKYILKVWKWKVYGNIETFYKKIKTLFIKNYNYKNPKRYWMVLHCPYQKIYLTHHKNEYSWDKYGFV